MFKPKERTCSQKSKVDRCLEEWGKAKLKIRRADLLSLKA